MIFKIKIYLNARMFVFIGCKHQKPIRSNLSEEEGGGGVGEKEGEKKFLRKIWSNSQNPRELEELGFGTGKKQNSPWNLSSRN